MQTMLQKMLDRLDGIQQEQKHMIKRQEKQEEKMRKSLSAMKKDVANATKHSRSPRRKRSRSRSRSRSSPRAQPELRRSPRITGKSPNRARKKLAYSPKEPGTPISRSSSNVSRSSTYRVKRSTPKTGKKKRTPKPDSDQNARKKLANMLLIFDTMLYEDEFQIEADDGTPTQFFDYDKFTDYTDEYVQKLTEKSADPELAAKCQKWVKEIGTKRRRYLRNNMDPDKCKSLHVCNN